MKQQQLQKLIENTNALSKFSDTQKLGVDKPALQKNISYSPTPSQKQ